MFLSDLVSEIQIFADASSLSEIKSYVQVNYVSGFTTNPSLLRKGGVGDYRDFALAALDLTAERPISFEVVSDDLGEMARQARVMAKWGPNVFVKIPIMTTTGDSTGEIVRDLAADGVQLNVTAILTEGQVAEVAANIEAGPAVIISVFAGRIADTGVDPVPVMERCRGILSSHSNAQLLWGSPREVLNVVQAANCGCDIITATPAILDKLHLLGTDLTDLSRATVQMFVDDARNAGFAIL